MSTQKLGHDDDEGVVASAVSAGAAAVLLISGVIGIFQAISALAHDRLLVVGPRYVYQLNLTAWGLIHLLLGIVAVVIAIGLFQGAAWARIGGIFIASVSIVGNFLWIPYYPVWAIVLIAIDVFAIWAISEADDD